MRIPELPLEPAERDGSFGFAQDDRKPQFIGPSAELMPGGEQDGN